MKVSIRRKMSDGAGCDVTLVYKDGRKLKGYIDTYESRYDNDGEASICFEGEHGEMLIVEEHELADVIIDKDDIFNKMKDAYGHTVTLIYKDGHKLKGNAVGCLSQYDCDNTDRDAKIWVEDERGKEHVACGSELEDVIIKE